MTIFFTIFAGVVTLVIGQIALKIFIDPVQEFKRVISEISLALIEHANVFGNPGILGVDIEIKVSGELRKLSSRLSAQMYLIPAYEISAKIFFLPSKKEVTKAARYLIGLSNGFGGNIQSQGFKNSFQAQRICEALGIYVSDTDRINPENIKDIWRD